MSALSSKTLLKLLSGVTVAAVMLAGAELMLRVVLGPPPPPVAVYSGLQPHEHYFSTDEGSVTADYQSRDPFPPWPAAVPHPRAAVIGGSSVHERSAGVRPEGEFPALIAAATGIDTLNLGSPALDSHDLVRLVEELLVSPPDVLVVYTGHNDFGNTYFNQRYGNLSAGLSARAQAGMEQLQLFCQLRRLIAPLSQATSAGPSFNNQGAPISRTQWWAALRYLEANLRRIVWMSDKADVPVVLVTPVSALARPPAALRCMGDGPCAMELWRAALEETDPLTSEALMRRARDTDGIPMRAPSQAIDAVRRVAQEEGAILVDAERDLPRHIGLDTPADGLFHDHVHFTAAGHAAMAELIAPAVQTAMQTARE
ncbi:MAG: lysophospholipase L1-like esterase [Myxococcota bacterium]|jgi:lysophospholipase L1-like esterase